MKFVTYPQWSLRTRGATRDSHPIGATKGITAHWEGPHMGRFPHSECVEKVRGIQRYHRDVKHWADIAYNALVCPHGYVFEGRGLWTKSAANGGAQQNDDYYAVCYLGGVGDPFTDEAKEGFRDAFNWLSEKGGAGPVRNGHKDVRPEPTACPGEEIYRWVHSLRNHNEEDDMPSAKEVAEEVWGHKLRNRTAEGEKQAPMPAENFLTNIEWNNDRDLKPLKKELAEVREELSEVKALLKTLIANQ